MESGLDLTTRYLTSDFDFAAIVSVVPKRNDCNCFHEICLKDLKPAVYQKSIVKHGLIVRLIVTNCD